MKITRSSHNQLKIQNLIFYILFVAIIIALGYLSKTYKFQSDWTFGNRNTLTEKTQAFLGKLEQPLKFVAYVPEDPLLHEELAKIFNKYKHFKADTKFEFINPDLEPAKTKNAGISYAGQIAVHIGSKQEIIEATDEQTIVEAMHRMNRSEQPLVLFLEGHKERDLFAQGTQSMSKLNDVLKRQGFMVQPHNLIRTQSIPNQTEILVIASPQADLLEGEIDIIKNYISKGGNLLWLQDPDATQSLTPLADQLGITTYQGTVVDSNIELQQLLGIQHAAAIPVIDYGKSPITQNIQTQTLFPFSTMIEENFDAKIKDDINWQYDAFLSSMPSTWLETGEQAEETEITFDPDKDDKQGPIPLAISLKKPLSIDAENPDKPQGEQRIIVMGDSDFLLDGFIGYGANLDLALNIFNWLSSEDNLVDISAQTAKDVRLELSERVLLLFSVFFLILLPLGLLLTGVFIWLRRRKS